MKNLTTDIFCNLAYTVISIAYNHKISKIYTESLAFLTVTKLSKLLKEQLQQADKTSLITLTKLKLDKLKKALSYLLK